MTGERRETTILSNVNDGDLSIVSSDARTRSQSQGDYEWLGHIKELDRAHRYHQ